MTADLAKTIGYSCAYAPVALIHAAGFTPFRILPMGASPEAAGRILHDNLCPVIKRILDRAMSNDIPPLRGMVFMNSCDSMRRLSDAWQVTRADVASTLLELPVTSEPHSVAYFEHELHALVTKLAEWGGQAPTDSRLRESIRAYNHLAEFFSVRRSQSLLNQAMTTSPDQILGMLQDQTWDNKAGVGGTPVYLFGNVLSDPEAFKLFHDCGARIVGDDLCTGSRAFQSIPFSDGESAIRALARGILGRKSCARTIIPGAPEMLGVRVVQEARACGARGVIGHTAKFCDPYLSRVPLIREKLKREKIPFLFLEGDCTLGSIGQQRTRIEAFVEMLG